MFLHYRGIVFFVLLILKLEMGSDANRLRRKWQDYSGNNALIAETDFYETFNGYFSDLKEEYKIISKP